MDPGRVITHVVISPLRDYSLVPNTQTHIQTLDTQQPQCPRWLPTCDMTTRPTSRTTTGTPPPSTSVSDPRVM